MTPTCRKMYYRNNNNDHIMYKCRRSQMEEVNGQGPLTAPPSAERTTSRVPLVALGSGREGAQMGDWWVLRVELLLLRRVAEAVGECGRVLVDQLLGLLGRRRVGREVPERRGEGGLGRQVVVVVLRELEVVAQ